MRTLLLMTFLQTYTRFLYLIGETDVTAITDVQKSHINAFVKDIVNAFPFSWDLKTADLTLSAGTASIGTDYNPTWQLDDARIGDTVLTQIDIKDRADAGDDVYWITYNTTTSRYIFNTPTQSGTVTIYYHYTPSDMTTDNDVCVVPDGEAVAYGAAAKNWVGDERNESLQANYEKEAASRVQRMYNQDLNFGPKYLERSKVIDQTISSAGG